MKIVGSIPCEGCGKNIIRGIVYKVGEYSFICEGCRDSGDEFEVIVDETKEQFQEITE